MGDSQNTRPARLMLEGLDTSPGVQFPPGAGARITVDDRSLLVEGDPCILDHIAICERGRWTRDGPPGVQGRRRERRNANKILSCLDSLGKRMDSYEARKDGAEAALMDRHKKAAVEEKGESEKLPHTKDSEMKEEGGPRELKADSYADSDEKRNAVAEVQSLAHHAHGGRTWCGLSASRRLTSIPGAARSGISSTARTGRALI